ncbi:MAG: polyphenol oxidase family protein [Propionibacteriaceae bacterium]|nr:polyphenol oxidase family protein [Propionibacteriaceae bacterium]
MTFSTVIDPASNLGVGVAFTDRLGGVSEAPHDSLDLGRPGVDPSVDENVAIVGAAIGCQNLAMCSQVHGTHVVTVDASYPFLGVRRGPAPEADAMVCVDLGMALVIRVADCVPVLLADPKRRVIGAAHAGRVGLLAGVLHETVEAMRGMGARDITAWIGPHVCASCYEVPPQMAEDAWSLIPATRGRSARGTPAIDLGEGAQAALIADGVRVTRCDPCTSCDPRFFSYRRDQGRTGRQAGVIWLDSAEPWRVSPPELNFAVASQ